MKDDSKLQDIISRELDVRASDRTYNSMRQIVLDAHESSKQKPSAARLTVARRIIMKSRYAKVAAAAVIIIAVLIGLPGEDTVTFADVVEPILNAKTMIFDLIMGGDESGTTIHDIVVGSRIRRTMSNLPNITLIFDPDSGRVLVLDSEAKKAMYMDIGDPEVTGARNYLAAIREVIELVLNDQDGVEELGEQVIDGQKAIVFVARGPNDQITIWADPKTALPIRIEVHIEQEIAVILKNFEFDATVDDALVSMEEPDEYKSQETQETQIELGEATEQDFVESLRICAEIVRDGTFPDSVGSENASKAIRVLVQKLTQMDITQEAVTDLMMKFARGMLFPHQMASGPDGWHYAGAGVKLGDAATAIFWYQSSGSDTYRVIYGDLSVKDVAQENLPK
jgi:outer membrane lipoprotein-sorting protein